MAAPLRSAPANNLLQLLPDVGFQLLAPDLKPAVLPKGTPLAHQGKPIDAVFSGIGSVVITTSGGRRAEAGIFGFDGYIPTSAVTGAQISSYDVAVQLNAEGHSMDYDDFCRWMDQSKRFVQIMNRSMESLPCNWRIRRCPTLCTKSTSGSARWLLMCHDRSRSDEVAVTHELLSVLLSVIIRNRSGLEAFARDCYGRPEAECRRLMGGRDRP